MKEQTFEWLWKQMEADIYDLMGQITTACGEDKKRKFSFRMTYGDETKHVIKDEYLEIKKELKKRCYSATEDDEEAHLIDQHKIAACFCKAFIRKKVFSFDLNENTPSEMILSNYTLAYTVSLRIIFLYLLDYYRDPKTNLSNDLKKKCIAKLQASKTLIVPNTTPTHDKYNMGRIKTLALNDYYGLSVDLLTYADMMFWIEYYNKIILEERSIGK